MKVIPEHNRIYLDSYHEDGEIIFQQKLEGAYFSFGLNEDGVLLFRSKTLPLEIDTKGEPFKSAILHILKVASEGKLDGFPNDIYFYSKIIKKDEKIHITLFDITESGKSVNYFKLVETSKLLEINVVPKLSVRTDLSDNQKEFLK